MEEIAVQIEDPFGSKANDLPLEAYTLAVQADVLRLLDEASIGASSRGLAGALPADPRARPRPPAPASPPPPTHYDRAPAPRRLGPLQPPQPCRHDPARSGAAPF